MARACKECGFPLTGNEQTCPECGAPVGTTSTTQSRCPECGYPLTGSETACPECGNPLQAQQPAQQPQQPQTAQQPATQPQAAQPQQTTQQQPAPQQVYYAAPQPVADEPYRTASELFWSCQFYKVFKGKHFDLGQRLYECFDLWWECVKVWWYDFKNRFCQFSGRASRREFFSFVGFGGLAFPLNPFFILSLMLIVGFIPWLAITVRRYHDIGKSGWWMFVPIANFFLLFKKSDDGPNEYGHEPDPVNQSPALWLVIITLIAIPVMYLILFGVIFSAARSSMYYGY